MRTIVAAIFGFIVGTFAEQWANDCYHDELIAHAFDAGYRAGSGTAHPFDDAPVAERISN